MWTTGYQEFKREKKKSKLEKLLNNSTIDILDQTVGVWPVPCKILSNIFGLYSRGASNTPFSCSPCYGNQKCLQTLRNVSGAKLPLIKKRQTRVWRDDFTKTKELSLEILNCHKYKDLLSKRQFLHLKRGNNGAFPHRPCISLPVLPQQNDNRNLFSQFWKVKVRVPAGLVSGDTSLRTWR